MSKMIAIKVKSFPQVSETFVVSSIVFALKNKFKVHLYVSKYRGVNNSSQADILRQYNIEKNIEKPFSLSKNKLIRWCQLAYMALHPRILPYVFTYYKNKSKRDTKPLLELYQYRHFKKNALCHVHFNNALHPLPKLAEIGYITPKVIVTFHGYDVFLETAESFQAKYGAFYKKYVKAVTVNSNYLKQAVLNLGVEEQLIKVVPIGFDGNVFNGTPKTINSQQQIEIITVGRLVQLKGHLYGLWTIKRLKDQGNKVHYTIVGEGAERAKLKNETKSLGLEEQVTFAGASSQEQVKSFMEKSHIFLMTSTYDDLSGRREAFGLVSIEAQAMGLPVVGFKSGGFPDTIVEGKTGFAVEDRNDKALTDKILQLLENPNVYQTMSKAAIHHSAAFGQKFTTQQYLNLYEELLKIS